MRQSNHSNLETLPVTKESNKHVIVIDFMVTAAMRLFGYVMLRARDNLSTYSALAMITNFWHR
jgi:hypothetical protein